MMMMMIQGCNKKKYNNAIIENWHLQFLLLLLTKYESGTTAPQYNNFCTDFLHLFICLMLFCSSIAASISYTVENLKSGVWITFLAHGYVKSS